MKRGLVLVLVTLLLWPGVFSVAAPETSTYSGYILRAEDSSATWYVNPVDNRAYSLAEGRADLLDFGLGVSNKDFYSFAYDMPERLYGRILIRVQDKGQAYYVNPKTGRLFYIGREIDFSKLVSRYGKKMSSAELSEITGVNLQSGDRTTNFKFVYQNKEQSISEVLKLDTYELYNKSAKVLTYDSDNPPADLRAAFYQMFVAMKPGDGTLIKVVNDLRSLAEKNDYSDDQLMELAAAFVQYIPYDDSKLQNNTPNYIYETLYKNSGVCSDKTFLLYAILKELGYGVVIFDYPDANHSAIGVACPKEDSTYGTGYCFVETTNYFPVGILPQAINKGQASGNSAVSNVFSTEYLGRMESYLAITGKEYQGLDKTKEVVSYLLRQENNIKDYQADLQSQVQELDDLQDQLGSYKARLDQYLSQGNTAAYNAELGAYNELVADYNELLEGYKIDQDTYNSLVKDYNDQVDGLYQQ